LGDEKPTKAGKTRDEIIELIVVVLLGVTALSTAWASWIGSLHGGNQATNYTRSNNLASESNGEYSVGAQTYMSDLIIYNDLNNLSIDAHFAETQGDKKETERIEMKVSELMNGSVSEGMAEALQWAMEEGQRLVKEGADPATTSVSPFDMEGFIESYFTNAAELTEKSDRALEEGKRDNQSGDALGLVTVIYSIVLFLLGIVSTFKGWANKVAVTGIAALAFAIATGYMLTLPLPTGFDIIAYFGG